VVGTEDDALIPLIRKVSALGHEVHATVATDAREDTHDVILAAGHEHGFATEVDAQVIAGIRHLRDVGEGNPILCGKIAFVSKSRNSGEV
jgi:hypothetical protein